jgi:hypothetical protein
MKKICLAIASVSLLYACNDAENARKKTMKIYTLDSLHFQIEAPMSWKARQNKNEPNAVTFFENLQNGTDEFEENISIWYESLPLAIADSTYAKAAITQLKITNPNMDISGISTKKIGENIFHGFQFNFTRPDSSHYTVQGYTCLKGLHGYNFICTSDQQQMAAHQAVFDSILTTFKPL